MSTFKVGDRVRAKNGVYKKHGPGMITTILQGSYTAHVLFDAGGGAYMVMENLLPAQPPTFNIVVDGNFSNIDKAIAAAEKLAKDAGVPVHVRQV